MTCRENNNAISEITEILFNEGMNGLDTAISILINEAMQFERNRHLKAKPYERSNERQGYANGFKDKKLKTRVGALNLKIPQVRDGDFYPSFLEKGLRSGTPRGGYQLEVQVLAGKHYLMHPVSSFELMEVTL